MPAWYQTMLLAYEQIRQIEEDDITALLATGSMMRKY